MQPPTNLIGLCCPRDRTALTFASGEVICAKEHRYRFEQRTIDFSPDISNAFYFHSWMTAIYDWSLPLFSLPRVFGVRRDCLERLHQRAISAAQGRTLLDVPGGTGLFSIKEAARVGVASYLGADLSLPMLRRSAARLQRFSLAGTLLCCDLMQLPCVDGAVDVVLCSLGLQFVAKRNAALAELRRVVAPGGRFFGAAPALGLDRRYDQRHAKRKRKDFPLDHSTFSAELNAAGFRLIQSDVEGALVLWEAEAIDVNSA